MTEAYKEIQILSKKIRLTPNTKFLAYYLSKQYLNKFFELKRREPLLIEIHKVTHSCVFLASKMRERDIYCPMISHMLVAGDRHLV